MDRLIRIINSIRANKSLNALEVVDPKYNFRDDLGFDSFDLAELTVRIEDEFNVDIFEDGLVSTVGEAMAKLNIK